MLLLMSDIGIHGQNLDLCVCIPARNEADRLPIVLDAIAAQNWPKPILVIVVINNSTDDSLAAVKQASTRHLGRLVLHAEFVTFPPDLAHAGSARRLAMDSGLALLPNRQNGVLISTDADTRPPPEWLTNIAHALSRGVDMVGGRIEIEPDEPLPPRVIALRLAWDRYWHKVRAIEDELDPLPWDPAPRHGDHTGASLAITAELYVRCGGVPPLPSGEDCALVTAALAQEGRLSHPADVFTFVSPRRDGRAQEGMAQSMQTLFECAAREAAPSVPGFHHWRERAVWRRQLRARPEGHALVAQAEQHLPAMPHDMVLEITL